MTYGSAATAEEVPAYLRSVRGGRDADPELVAEFQRRYRLIGWSPLVRITLEQGAELQRLLDAEHGAGRCRVEVGMLHSEPRIDQAVARLAVAGVRCHGPASTTSASGPSRQAAAFRARR